MRSGRFGELPTTIEERYGQPGWKAFAQGWRDAVGIVQPVPSRPQRGTPIHALYGAITITGNSG
jgi:hypothetical protein